MWFWLEPNFGVTASDALGVAGIIFVWAGFGSAADVTEVLGLVAVSGLDAGFGAASSFLITRFAVALIIILLSNTLFKLQRLF